MKQVFQVLIIAVFMGVFAAPSFAAVEVANVDNIATIDDEPKKKEEGESEKKSAEGEEAKKKSECKHSEEEKASCKKEKSSCSKK